MQVNNSIDLDETAIAHVARRGVGECWGKNFRERERERKREREKEREIERERERERERE